jgi:hypothetical protein
VENLLATLEVDYCKLIPLDNSGREQLFLFLLFSYLSEQRLLCELLFSVWSVGGENKRDKREGT